MQQKDQPGIIGEKEQIEIYWRDIKYQTFNQGNGRPLRDKLLLNKDISKYFTRTLKNGTT